MTAIPDMPIGITFDHSTVSVTAYLAGDEIERGYVPGHITVEVYLDVIPGTLPDFTAFTGARWELRANRIRARFSDGTLGQLDIEGLRIKKDGTLSQRQPGSRQIFQGRCSMLMAGDPNSQVLGADVIKAALDAYLAAHPLPTLHLRPGVAK